MEPRFTRGEYWMLETAVEHRLPVSVLTASNLEEILNKTGHRLTRDALIETLYRLITSGLISVEHEVDGMISTHQHIERALNEPRRIPRVGERKRTRYGLTQEGGAQWEAFAAPDWQNYIAGSVQLPDEGEYEMWELICGNKNWRSADKDRSKWLKRYIESMCFYSQKEVFSESVEWDYVTPWDATYWKQLEGGHRVRFRCRDKSEGKNFKPPPPPFGVYFHRMWYAWQ